MCVRCGKYFTNKKGLKGHILRMHTSNRKKPLVSHHDQMPITMGESAEIQPTINETSKSAVSLASSIRIITAYGTEDQVKSPAHKKKKNEEEEKENTGGNTVIENILKDMLDNCPIDSSDDKNEEIESNYQCGVRGQTFSSQKESETHISTEHTNSESQCWECGTILQTDKDLDRHISQHNPTET